MGDRSAPPWTAADNALLVRAWGVAAAESAPKSATARAVFAHFQQLSAGGESGRAEKAVQARRSLLHNMYAVIRSHDARALSPSASASASASAAVAAAPSSPSDESVEQQHESAWFQLAEPERRVRFAEINKRSWMQFVNLTSEQFTDIAALKSLAVSDAVDVSENEAAASDDELSARTVRWRAEDTTTLLRAWEQVAAESAPKRVTVREIIQRFEQLSEGGSSGRAEVSVVQRHTILRNMHAVIHAHDTRALAESESTEHAVAAAADEEEEPSAPRLWFSLAEDERRRCFTELNTRKWLQYAKLTEEQFATISAVKSLAAAPPVVAVVAPPEASEADRVGEFAMKTHRWKSEDTTLLVRAWAEVAMETAKVTAKEVAKRFETLSEGGCSGRSVTAVPQKHTVIRNMYTIICVHDERAVAEAAQSGESVPRLWFDLSKDERRRFFTEMNKKAWTHYVELTEDQYQAISTIKNSRMTEPAAVSEPPTADAVADAAEPAVELPVPEAAETPTPAVKDEARQPTPRAFWSTRNTTLLLRAWAEAREAKGTPHPSPAEVVQHFQALAKDKEGHATNESSIRLRHSMLHNMYSIICAYAENLAKDGDDESKAEEKLPWFSLVYDERRRFFAAMNVKASCWFVDLSEDHFNFISDTSKKDVGAAAETLAQKEEGDPVADADQVRRPRGMWTTEHTTTMLRAWREVVSEKSSVKPTTGTVYQHFLELSNGSGGAESSFIHRFRSLRFLHSTIVAFEKAEASKEARSDGSNESTGDENNDNEADDHNDTKGGDTNTVSEANTADDSGNTKSDDDNDNKGDDNNDTKGDDSNDTKGDDSNDTKGDDSNDTHGDDINTMSEANTVEDSNDTKGGDNIDSKSGNDSGDMGEDNSSGSKDDDNTGNKGDDANDDKGDDANDDKGDVTNDKGDDSNAKNDTDSSDSKSAVSNTVPASKWFELTPKERRKRFNDAGGKALLFVDITRGQFDELSSILSDKSLPMPMITRRADTRDGGGKKRVRLRAKNSQQEESGAQQTAKQRKLLPALTTSKPGAADSEERSQPASDDSDEESDQFAHTSEPFDSERVKRMKKNDNDSAEARTVISQKSDVLERETSPSVTLVSTSQIDRDESSAESEPENQHELVGLPSPFRRVAVRKADDTSSSEQQLKRKRHEKLLFVHRDVHVDASRPPEKRMRAQSRLLAAAALITTQTRALEQMLRETREARARDRAERQTIVRRMAEDERERLDGIDVLHGRLDEIRRQRAAWREERDEVKRVRDGRCE